MNKIYALKYSAKQDALIPVPEFATRVKKSSRMSRTALAIILATITMGTISFAQASVVREDIAYQTFRDFAENKGKFAANATNITIYDKKGAIVGYLDKAPMPDFSSANFQSGIAALISPQYIVSVKHNGGYQSVSFGNGQNNYNLVTRNNHPSLDFHAPRLNKLVTEVAPALVTDAGTVTNIYADKERFPVFYRVGSGSQQIKDRAGKTVWISGAYGYLTGGTVGSPWSYNNGKMISSRTTDTFNPEQGPLSSSGLSGDSGSPLYAYDTTRQAWVLVGTLSSGSSGGTNWAVIQTDFTDKVMQDDQDGAITFKQGISPLRWKFNAEEGTGTLAQGEASYIMHGQKGNDLNAGKNLTLQGNAGHIVLENSVNQGAGALTFNGNYTVSSENDATWTGAGLNIAKNAEVTWQVNGVSGDNLHKIGEGVLRVAGHGVNPGGLKVGDGTVILAQRPDENGQVQAFSTINLASGRPTVVLSDSHQINPDKISWGFRGGRLDINGNDIAFRILNAADNGASIVNSSKQAATVSLTPYTDTHVPINEWDANKRSGGAAGLLYIYNNPYSHTVDYFIQKKKGYGYFPTNQTTNNDWEFVGHDKENAIELVKSRRPIDDRIYHGNIAGNINLQTDTSHSDGGLIFDGNIDTPAGEWRHTNGRLTLQGHPVIHAFNSKGIADTLKNQGDNSVRTQPTSFDQSDWETRTFRLNSLQLNNTTFELARNAVFNGDIKATRSTVRLGSPDLYIDLNDGTGKKVTPQRGASIATDSADMSRYQGSVTLQDQSTLTINEIFNGDIQGQNSQVTVKSTQAQLTGYSNFSKTPLTLQPGASLTANGGWWSDATISVDQGARLTLAGTPNTDQSGQVSPNFYSADYGQGFRLRGDAALKFSPYTFVSGDIQGEGASRITIGGDDEITLSDKLSQADRMMYSLFNNFRNVYAGQVTLPQGQMSMSDTLWQISGHSHMGALHMQRSLAGFTGKAFSTLTTDTLQANQSAFALKTDLQDSDKLVINKRAEGRDNTLLVNFLRQPSVDTPLNIPLVTAPAGTDHALFKAANRVIGFSLVTPTIRSEEKDGQVQWILDGYRSAPDKGSATSANSFMAIGYKNFMTEVNNLNKRMGELRDTQGADGLWVRLMNGAGTGDVGYSDRYTHLQTGFDKKHRLAKGDLFTGILMSYTNSSASGQAYTGNTHSLGGGLYASMLFDSGAYLDVIGKYVHHDNDYNAQFANLGKRSYGTHSWYAGVEGGYRYALTESLYIEPQAELVYGSVSGTTLKWSDNGMDVSMRNKTYNPLIGRTGVALGKTLSGEGWRVTARAGIDWQFDLIANGETALRDASGEKRFTGKKDSRMLYNLGMNAEVKDNTRFGLTLERSAFGKYNIDHAINANFRYTF
ncbi:autotransporter outer membrane beta-barrel domain-containing protein [Edwardsiella tarda]|uniref:Autotransporter outer membrane beta-barrel domain-containing protein n=2 Tax=Edwardsiella tarda TaxID=636 RepID=A0A2A7U5C7_EDWTA|nr:S6 family peptidase [Edwardsiella tarda]PEH73453.1 autotransporter outer membrane beta-barrel domain-containing protein [Edwardsiella tarda]UAL57506.1 autotransporter outer membrane beta-barrel domain-containing protein [Edwardsiella tarda]UCP99433.1 autotransporter outer membrane beta-barrel domain-containing protein [Edwardsiella tarda ATCC 15947 = NBRC 105688]UCQ17148.1 autotransporter outer membrane beta-barrel domain-containing protein [Edwardsiella tarda]WGE28313.1 autotransporter out